MILDIGIFECLLGLTVLYQSLLWMSEARFNEFPAR